MGIGVAVLLTVVPAVSALASGSYVRASLQRAGLDDYPKYELGKSLSQGRIELPDPSRDRLEHQHAILAEMADHLPHSAHLRNELPSLAGRLSDEQLDAVRYYLKIRYRVR